MKTVEQFQRAYKFLSHLVEIGARPEQAPILEQAYWDILQTPTGSRWDNEAPFMNGNGAAVDIGKCADALRELSPAQESREISGAFFDLVHLASRSNAMPVEPELAVKVTSFSVGTFFRCAAFVAVARAAGVFEARESELERMTAEAVQP